MLKKILGYAIIFGLSSFALSAQAARGSSSGVIFSLNTFMYNTTSESTPGSKSDSKISLYDLKLGYLDGSGMYLGGIYSSKSSESSNVTRNGSAVGASLGYVGSQGFFITGHYLASATYDTLEEGSGIQVDLGYLNNVTGPLLMGVELSYRAMEYKKDKNNSSLESYKTSELMPMLTIGFVF